MIVSEVKTVATVKVGWLFNREAKIEMPKLRIGAKMGGTLPSRLVHTIGRVGRKVT